MRDECTSPGTMWASVMMPDSHGMSRLHVCIDMIIFPFGSTMILIGCVAGRMFTATDPSTRKCPVAPESEQAQLTAFFKLIVLKMVFTIGSSCRLLAWIICCHAAEQVVVCCSCCRTWAALILVPRAPLL